MRIEEVVSLRAQIRRLITLFIIGLVLSGLSAFPLEWELGLLKQFINIISTSDELTHWINRIHQGLTETNSKYPFLAYGTDWLAFAHIMIAIVFIGPLRDPVKNIWVIQFGLIACLAVLPLAIIAGHIRQIPIYWRLLDCSFGIVGGLVLWQCYKKIRSLMMHMQM